MIHCDEMDEIDQSNFNSNSNTNTNKDKLKPANMLIIQSHCCLLWCGDASCATCLQSTNGMRKSNGTTERGGI